MDPSGELLTNNADPVSLIYEKESSGSASFSKDQSVSWLGTVAPLQLNDGKLHFGAPFSGIGRVVLLQSEPIDRLSILAGTFLPGWIAQQTAKQQVIHSRALLLFAVRDESYDEYYIVYAIVRKSFPSNIALPATSHHFFQAIFRAKVSVAECAHIIQNEFREGLWQRKGVATEFLLYKIQDWSAHMFKHKRQDYVETLCSYCKRLYSEYQCDTCRVSACEPCSFVIQPILRRQHTWKANRVLQHHKQCALCHQYFNRIVSCENCTLCVCSTCYESSTTAKLGFTHFTLAEIPKQPSDAFLTTSESPTSKCPPSEYPVISERVKVPKIRCRTGCIACQGRRKKCDEQRPICVGCQRQNTNCVYEEPVPWIPRVRKIPKISKGPITRRRSGCATCRGRGKKCSEERPMCGNCKRMNIICGYEEHRTWIQKRV